MSAAVAVLVSCSVLHLLRPWTLCVSAASGQFGAKGPVCGYGMLRAPNAKSVLADLFQYLIVVSSMSKKSLFPWQILRAEFRAPFQDPIRAGVLLLYADYMEYGLYVAAACPKALPSAR